MNNFMNLTSAVNMDRLNLSEVIPLEWPLVLYIEISGYCNLKCKFCPQSTMSAKLKKDNMSLTLFKKIIDELYDKHVKVKKIRLCGMGECLVNTEFSQMLEYLRTKDVAACIDLVTNGILMTESIAQTIAQSCDIVRFSIEGLSDNEYAMVTGEKVNYKQLINNISYLYSIPERKSKVCVKIHGNSIKNQANLEAFYTTFEPISDELSVEQLCNMWPDFHSDFVINESKFRFSLNGENYDSLTHQTVCPQIFKAVQIYANGDIVPCCYDWERQNIIGNIRYASLKDIWRGEKLKTLQLAHLNLQREKLTPCNTCMANDYTEVDNIDSSRIEILKRI